jgi:hypothetical protein
VEAAEEQHEAAEGSGKTAKLLWRQRRSRLSCPAEDWRRAARVPPRALMTGGAQDSSVQSVSGA